ncbi:hypothetical protein PVZ87_19320 [Bordetella pertussis]|nr:hypothetical protein PVZ87_19320 [Bordetella pertussis]
MSEDAHTHTRTLDEHRPLYVFEMDDPARTRLYVSSSTGEVVRDAPRLERGWNYVGAWLHWLYPLRGAYWHDIVVWLSVLGVALTVSGTVVGLWRWRFRAALLPAAAVRRTARRFMRWHHIAGLLFAATNADLDIQRPDVDESVAGLRHARHAAGPRGVSRRAAAGRQPAGGASRGHAGAQTGVDPRGRPDAAAGIWRGGRAGAAHGRRRGAAHRWRRPPWAWRSGGCCRAPRRRASRCSTATTVTTTRARRTRCWATWKSRCRYGASSTTIRAAPGCTSIRAAARFWAAWNGRAASAAGCLAFLHSWDWPPLLQRRPAWDAVLIVLSLAGCC